ncbi:MAG: sugar-binding domain-containing protein, partial [Ferruginibacter sp.]
MKNRNALVMVCMIVLFPFMLEAQMNRRFVVFNNDWKFYKGEIAAAEKEHFNDAKWRSIRLPHDWSIEGPFSKEWASGTAFLPGGTGWYRKSFNLPAGFNNKKVFIYFDGVYNNSQVWINGHLLGNRPNGFASFQYELTPYLKPNGKNTIAVKVNHTKFADSRWYTGSGIYRNVYLRAVDPLHIDLWGVSFTTPFVSPSAATASVAVSLKNSGHYAGSVLVKAALLDHTGKTMGSAQKKLIAKNNTDMPAGLSLNIANSQLWSVDTPYLYTLNVSVSKQGKTVDEWTENVGVRTIHFDANEGFFLNGVNIKQKGVCIHDDAGVLGVAVPEAVWVRRLRMLKNAGCNAIRMSHNPHADYLYNLCDKMGFLVMDESFDEWEEGKNKWIAGWNKGTPGKDGYHEYFSEWSKMDVRDMVLRNRNRPSIIMWSIGNEIDYPNDPYSHEILNTGKNPQIYGKGYLADHPAAARLGELSRQLAAVVKSYDTTRPVTAALAGVVMSNETSFPQNIDVVGYNYQEYRYVEDHAKYPDRIIYGSENGMQLSAWNAVDSNRFISGQYLWTGIDYLGEARDFPNRSNNAGLLNLAGFEKPEYYFRQSLWSAKPMIWLGTSNIPTTEDRGIWSQKRVDPVWNRKEEDSVRVSCFTNCDEAELFLNNQSLGKKQLPGTGGKILYWDIVYRPGKLMVKGTRGDKEVSNTLNTPGKVELLKATVYKDELIEAQSGFKQ